MTIPAEPAPATVSVNANIHRLSRVSSEVLVLEPGNSEWWAALIFLALTPVVLAVCLLKRADLRLTIGLTLFPVFGAAGCGVGAFCFHKFGTRARFDRDTRKVSVTGARHGSGFRYTWDQIQAVQFCAGKREPGQGTAHPYQVNLVVGTNPPSRLNLLNSRGKKPLRRIAAEIAAFLGVPFYVGTQPE